MKKVINQRRYDTDTAKLIGSADWGMPGDFRHWEEDLYQKKTGEFFIHGVGGPASKYAESIGQNEWRGGEKIIPLNYDNARDWVEKNLDADTYERLFELEDEENEKSTAYTGVYLTPSTRDKLDKMAAKQGKTRSRIVTELIENAEF